VKCELVNITPDAEKTMAYLARVSSPNQDNPEYARLLAYCMRHGHWSVFEMADMTVEIETSRAIAAQLLRHKSFSFQEFSQRYAVAPEEFELVPARSQDPRNRQASLDDLDQHTKQWFLAAQNTLFDQAYDLYTQALSKGIAKECARNLLPMGTRTRLYMKGSIRSYIHYLTIRCAAGTQPEHRAIAMRILNMVQTELPLIHAALISTYPHLGDTTC
jgi:thymidylate synthase (FAD)